MGPFVIIQFGLEEAKSETISNSLNPEWEFCTQYNVDNTSPELIYIRVLDDDYGKAELIGELRLDISTIKKDEKMLNQWLPLDKSKKGEVLMSVEYNFKRPSDNNVTITSDPKYTEIITQNELPKNALDVTKTKKNTTSPEDTSTTPERHDGLKGLKHLMTQDEIAEDNVIQTIQSGDKPITTVSYVGKLKITVVQAEELEKKDFLRKADPFVIVNYGSQSSQSEKVKNTFSPVWNHEATLDLNNTSHGPIEIKLMDWERLGKDEHMGRALIPVELAVSKSSQGTFWVNLHDCKSGKVLISTEFVGRGAQNIISVTTSDVTNIKKETVSTVLKDEVQLDSNKNSKLAGIVKAQYAKRIDESLTTKEHEKEVVAHGEGSEASDILKVKVHKARNLENLDDF